MWPPSVRSYANTISLPQKAYNPRSWSYNEVLVKPLICAELIVGSGSQEGGGRGENTHIHFPSVYEKAGAHRAVMEVDEKKQIFHSTDPCLQTILTEIYI